MDNLQVDGWVNSAALTKLNPAVGKAEIQTTWHHRIFKNTEADSARYPWNQG